ncbi:hypothetical protein pb186bvf_012986 [Paramecium bursaria]
MFFQDWSFTLHFIIINKLILIIWCRRPQDIIPISLMIIHDNYISSSFLKHLIIHQMAHDWWSSYIKNSHLYLLNSQVLRLLSNQHNLNIKNQRIQSKSSSQFPLIFLYKKLKKKFEEKLEKKIELL